jgi:plastocyanin
MSASMNSVRLMCFLACALALSAARPVYAKQPAQNCSQQVVVPEEDRFFPFALTIHAGDCVEWVNQDTDDHTVVSDDPFDTAGNEGTDHLLPGTDSNGGQPGTFVLHFNKAGTFVYYCRFHSHLDGDNQPVAPGPRGGIQDANGNFGTPMMGVVTVKPRGSGGGQDEQGSNRD